MMPIFCLTLGPLIRASMTGKQTTFQLSCVLVAALAMTLTAVVGYKYRGLNEAMDGLTSAALAALIWEIYGTNLIAILFACLAALFGFRFAKAVSKNRKTPDGPDFGSASPAEAQGR
jgi:hypothetical protein